MLTVRFDRLRLAEGSRVLDIGCGGGRHIRQTRRMRGVTAIGMDVGEQEVRDTAKTLRELDQLHEGYGGTVQGAGPWLSARGTVYALPFADAVFDCVIISEVLEHLHRDAQALAELRRVLKPGGVLAVSVPRAGPEAVCWALSREYRNTPGGHLRIYRRRRLKRLLQEQGYRVFDSHFAHGLHPPLWWLKCIFGLDNDQAPLVNAYHRFLVWDLMKRPLLTRALDALLNPLVGKSVVFYATRGP